MFGTLEDGLFAGQRGRGMYIQVCVWDSISEKSKSNFIGKITDIQSNKHKPKKNTTKRKQRDRFKKHFICLLLFFPFLKNSFTKSWFFLYRSMFNLYKVRSVCSYRRGWGNRQRFSRDNSCLINTVYIMYVRILLYMCIICITTPVTTS